MSVASPERPRVRVPDPKYMTFVEHLDELRHRLIISLGAIVVGAIAGWFLSGFIIHLIDAPIREYLNGHKLVVPEVYGAFTLHLKVAIVVGFVFALPVTLWQIWGFIAPAFGPKANRFAPIVIFTALFLFASGATTAYFVMPLAIKFFAGFQSGDIQVIPFASDYVSFITLIILVFGISFELPLVLVSLTTIGVTSSGWLAKKRAFFFFGVFIFATVATPGADWISPLILGGILYFLYEISILISRLLGK